MCSENAEFICDDPITACLLLVGAEFCALSLCTLGTSFLIPRVTYITKQLSAGYVAGSALFDMSYTGHV